MKKTVKAGVLTGLILAPAAVVSANETDVVMDGEQLAPIVTEDTSAVAVPYNTVADLDVTKLRLEEIFNLNEKSSIANFQAYRDLVDSLLPDDPNTPEKEYKNDRELLLAKLDFLEQLQGLKSRANSLTNEINLLKTTHPTLFNTVPGLEVEYAAIARDFKTIREELDSVITKYEGNDYDLNVEYGGAFETKALGGMASYLATIEDFEKEFIKNIATLKTFIENIKKPEAFIYGGEVILVDVNGDIILDNVTGEPVTEIVHGYITDIILYDVLDASAAATFKQVVEEATSYYTEKMTPNEKKIADSHVLNDGRTVATVMKQANDDLTAANKVADLITGIQSVTAVDYKSKVGKIVADYEKLNVRAKMLVLDYETKVANQVDANGRNTGYKDGLDFIVLVDALKPNATDEYRTALEVAEKAASDLATDLQNLLSSYNDKLTAYRTDVTAVELVENQIEALTTASNVTSTDIENARQAYDALTSNQKKIVNNYKELQDWEKSGKTTIKLSDQIDAITIENKKTFATKVDALNKSYAKLSVGEQSLVASGPRLKYLMPFATVTGSYYNLKTTAESYKADVFTLHATLTATTGELVDILGAPTTNADDKTALQKLKDELTASVITLKAQLDSAATVIQNIEDANNETNKVEQLKLIQKARDAYNVLPKEEQRLVTNLKILTELEKVVKQPADTTKKIEAVDPENISKFPSTAKTAITAFEKLTATQKSYISDENQKRIEDFKVYLAFVEQIKALKPSAAGFQEAYTKAQAEFDKLSVASAWTSSLAPKIADAVKTYQTTLTTHNDSITNGNELVNRIDKLGLLTGQAFLNEAEAIEAIYASLSADAKKQVTNYKHFQTLKKDGTAALKVVDLINDPIIRGIDVANSGYAKKVEAAIKAYDKLTSRQKSYVYNYDSSLKPYLKVYEIVTAINNLKPSDKTYIEDVASIRLQYDRLSTVEQSYLAPILHKIEGAETGLVTVNEVMDLIDAARPGVENYVQKLMEAREAYDKLARINSSYQKLVLNYKTLQERENALKPVTAAIHQIEELKAMMIRPFNNARDFVKKYNDAVKAYEKIPYESRELVYNRDALLSTIYPVAQTMEAIANIKSSSKTFGEDVKKARELYNALSNEDKALVTNYSDLLAFENTVSGGSAVDELIRAIPSKSPSQYMQAIKDARAAYDALTANEKKAVTLYKELQNYEKGVKNVLVAIDAIDNLQFASNLISAYDKAMKALDKLTAEQRQMVPNMSKLQNVAPAIEVYKMIQALKPSSANYIGSVQAAYAAYNMLSSSEKQYVTNFAQLQEAKNNIDKVQEVISKISSISSSSRDYSKLVEEALALYNSLPSAYRKLVTNYDILQNAQKESGAVDQVRSLIAEINPNASNFESKVKSARSAYDRLTTQQKRLVSNYFMLEDYEEQLNDSSFFF
ncbi:hypothetical protein AAGS61_03600 [Lysinibacillus sp. KU-BSD001]|uniref:hypothetical protein n=1 Tax=Lysinibacillus sp. KU-BSD001 TaxID=3141328 RepID=UPI0036E0D56B